MILIVRAISCKEECGERERSALTSIFVANRESCCVMSASDLFSLSRFWVWIAFVRFVMGLRRAEETVGDGDLALVFIVEWKKFKFWVGMRSLKCFGFEIEGEIRDVDLRLRAASTLRKIRHRRMKYALGEKC